MFDILSLLVHKASFRKIRQRNYKSCYLPPRRIRSFDRLDGLTSLGETN